MLNCVQPNRISLSRKGFDSGYGRIPSPILPDGTLLSLPIPSKTDSENDFSHLYYGESSYYDIIHSLNPGNKIKENYYCHLDPDIRCDVKQREKGWKPAFGQRSASLGVLRKSGVNVGDLFLFFGWFRKTEFVDGVLRYIKNAPDLHVIYGYLQVGEIIDYENNIPEWLTHHPHAKHEYWNKPNAIFIADDKLSFNPDMPGAGVLKYDEKRVLTMEGKSRTIWSLPSCFRNISMTYHPNPWVGDEFHSAKKGQEFVFTPNSNVMEWVKEIIL